MSRWWAAGRQALRGRAAWATAVVALSMVRLLTDLGMGPSVATRAYLLALAALCLLWCARALFAAVAEEWQQPPYPWRPDPGRPTRLVTLEDAAEWAVRSAHLRDTRLRSDVRFAVADRLGRAGLYLGSDPRAAELLGPVTRELVESQTIAEPGSSTRGLDERQVRALAAELAGLDARIEQAVITARTPTGDNA